jgi:hypothetical protein
MLVAMVLAWLFSLPQERDSPKNIKVQATYKKKKHKSQGAGDLSLTRTKVLALLVQKYKY